MAASVRPITALLSPGGHEVPTARRVNTTFTKRRPRRSHGAGHMGQVTWSRSHSAGHMVQVTWVRSHGSGHMVQVTWVRSHGAGHMVQDTWSRSHGQVTWSGHMVQVTWSGHMVQVTWSGHMVRSHVCVCVNVCVWFYQLNQHLVSGARAG